VGGTVSQIIERGDVGAGQEQICEHSVGKIPLAGQPGAWRRRQKALSDAAALQQANGMRVGRFDQSVELPEQ
jgi:hypothetical protein